MARAAGRVLAILCQRDEPLWALMKPNTGRQPPRSALGLSDRGVGLPLMTSDAWQEQGGEKKENNEKEKENNESLISPGV